MPPSLLAFCLYKKKLEAWHDSGRGAGRVSDSQRSLQPADKVTSTRW